MSNNIQQQYKFAAITMSAALVLLAAATLPSTNNNVSAQETVTQYCFSEENENGIVLGFSCFDTRQECNEFRQAIKQSNDPNETGIYKVTNCKAEQQEVPVA